MIGYSTIKKQIKDIYIERGVIEAVDDFLKHIQTNPDWSQNDSLCSIAMDEIKLKNTAMFDSKTESVKGPHSYGFLVTVRGLTRPWKYPYFTEFDFPPTCEIILYIVKRLYEIGLTCLCLTSDQGSRNRKLFNKDHFDITSEKPYIPHPMNPKLKLFMSYDEIHLFKTLANHLRDDCCKLPDGTEFSIKKFHELLDKKNQSGSVAEIAMGKHLQAKYFNAKGQDRQTVSFVVKWISNATADLIDHFYPDDPDDLEDTANIEWAKISVFCRIMGDMHLVMSAKNNEACLTNKLHSPLGTIIRVHACSRFRSRF